MGDDGGSKWKLVNEKVLDNPIEEEN
jgi:hypothetical protein